MEKKDSFLAYRKVGVTSNSTLFVENAKDVIPILEEIKNSDREKMIAISLDEKNKILGTEIVAIGNISYTPISPKEIFKTPILLNAKKIIIAHNHPSGRAEASDPDIELTKILSKVGKTLEIELKYHIVIGKDQYNIINPDGEYNLHKYTENERSKYKINKVEPYIKQEVKYEGKHSITSPEEAVSYVKDILDNKEKILGIICLDTSNRVNSLMINNSSDNIDKDVYRYVVASNSKSVILVTNDENLFKRAGQRISKNFTEMDIDLLDIISKDNTKEKGYMSFREEGICLDINESKKGKSFYNEM